MNDRPFLSARHGTSGRLAVFEDTGVAAYLYLSSPGVQTIVADAWVYNCIEAPDINDIQAYRPDPPPAAAGYIEPEGYLRTPTAYSWSLKWAPDGHSVAVCADGVALAFIYGGQKPGFSRHLLQSGPWGEPWSNEIYAAAFASA
jgi:hypothetical protein